MQALDAPLAEDGDERAGIFLTNALTGWEPTVQKPLPFPELEEERDRAERVKQDSPILVILGNPPYNGFAGMAVDEERELSTAYRTTRRVRRPEGQGLNDLYVRFFRMAERRIAEKTGRGVVCFISNYSWLDGLSFTGMRERYLEAFDAIRIDCLNGDKYKTGKTTPDGHTGPQHLLDPGGPGRHPGRHRDHYAGPQRRPLAQLKSGRLPPPLGPDQARSVGQDGRDRAGDPLRKCLAAPAAGPAIRAHSGRRRLARLAGAARSIPCLIPGSQDQPGLVLGRRRP